MLFELFFLLFFGMGEERGGRGGRTRACANAHDDIVISYCKEDDGCFFCLYVST